ncbi:uncharacterized protein LOC130736127 [Lotus japonicus]|uniref:uncharacterized protein LOC130736127 n=1 Tax=Lotus japonicus TaxID=34305 RepID=UPI002586D512|nr:uncharacterized protein LOC130736127 [Lotus japonicus]
MAQLAQVMAQQAATVAAQTAAQTQREAEENTRRAEEDTRRAQRAERELAQDQIRMRTNFNRHGPPRFQGEVEPEKADLWIQEMGNIFEALHTPDAEKVNLATFMLKGDAEYWWRSAKQLMTANHVAISCESFKRAFMEKYIPETIREDMENKFLSLRQGTMTRRTRRFDGQRQAGRFDKSKAPPRKSYQRPVDKVPFAGRGGAAIPKEDVVCFKCNQKGHYANECGKEIVCWKCQKPGHVERNCPNAAKAEPVLNIARGRRPSAPGRVFAVSGEHAAPYPWYVYYRWKLLNGLI